ncbi:MAG: gliding motility-associated C-terminal domain-containing protein, partial [Saprospiraceae bacterium]|nr:gliding motility-associated C-terminal domain-containing protein [Saprospiraceae bacterium]
SGADFYSWEINSALSCTDCPNPLFTADTTTLFVISGLNNNNCFDTVHLRVFVLPEPSVDMPNAFTPNGDQKNDVFKPVGEPAIFTEYQLRVFSRWGERIYESFDFGDGWDGAINGLPAASDVYLYMFDYELIDGKTGHLTGEVILIR